MNNDSPIQSVSDLARRKRQIANKHDDLLELFHGTSRTIDRALEHEQALVDECSRSLAEIQERMAILEKIIPEVSTESEVSSSDITSMSCPNCKTSAFCVPRPPRLGDLVEGDGFNATLIAGLKMVRSRLGNERGIKLISCMKCGKQFFGKDSS